MKYKCLKLVNICICCLSILILLFGFNRFNGFKKQYNLFNSSFNAGKVFSSRWEHIRPEEDYN